jgi:membrane protein YqaA with SNARE-associated domain
VIRRALAFLIAAPWPLVVAVVFLVSALESAIFLGLVLPGELAVILGGALASRGRVPLAGVVAAGIPGPIVGDSIGYLLGRRYGRRYFRGRRREKWSRARLWLRRRGASAAFVGRFTAFLSVDRSGGRRSRPRSDREVRAMVRRRGRDLGRGVRAARLLSREELRDARELRFALQPGDSGRRGRRSGCRDPLEPPETASKAAAHAPAVEGSAVTAASKVGVKN